MTTLSILAIVPLTSFAWLALVITRERMHPRLEDK